MKTVLQLSSCQFKNQSGRGCVDLRTRKAGSPARGSIVLQSASSKHVNRIGNDYGRVSLGSGRG